jgi:ethanolamine-phosphate cytidylyltransferase
LKDPKAGDKIVYIDGSYDMIHIGHISTLANAKSKGDYLIVGLHDDDIISEKKGRHYPLLSLQERVLSVLAIKFVDEVIIGAPWKVTKTMMEQFKIDVVVSGSIDKNEVPLEHPEDDPY